MSRGRARFTQRDVARLVRAAEAVGKEVTAIRVEKDGTLVAVVGETGKAEADNPLDQWMADHARAAQGD
jgi:3D (Asp-Asp-Asp) domain-containing protein